jgi:hypothetical protein
VTSVTSQPRLVAGLKAQEGGGEELGLEEERLRSGRKEQVEADISSSEGHKSKPNGGRADDGAVARDLDGFPSTVHPIESGAAVRASGHSRPGWRPDGWESASDQSRRPTLRPLLAVLQGPAAQHATTIITRCCGSLYFRSRSHLRLGGIFSCVSRGIHAIWVHNGFSGTIAEGGGCQLEQQRQQQ